MQSDDFNNAVGVQLKQQREALGLTLEEVAERTRIKKSFLAALESGHYDDIPGQTYLVGFMRGYAAALGLDADEAVASFRAARKPDDEQSPLGADLETENSPEQPTSKLSSMGLFAALFLFVFLCSGAFLWSTYCSSDSVAQRSVEETSDVGTPGQLALGGPKLDPMKE